MTGRDRISFITGSCGGVDPVRNEGLDLHDEGETFDGFPEGRGRVYTMTDDLREIRRKLRILRAEPVRARSPDA
jgi:hypothetical protein